MARLLVPAVLAAFAAASAIAVAGISESVPTELKLKNRAPAFHGKVKAAVPACKSERRVKLFYELGPNRGVPPGRQLVGRTNSDGKGRWYIDATPLVSGAAYYAKAKQHIVEIQGVLVRCEPDFSRTITTKRKLAAGRGGGPPVAHVSGIVHIRNKPPYFHGNVGAENESCAGPRTVRLYKRKKNGARKLLGTTESDDAEGVKTGWEILVEPVKPGDYFATAPKYRVSGPEDPAGLIVCERAKSRTITVD